MSVFDVAAALKKRYRDFNHYNLKDPLDELLFIICSTKTGEASYRSTFCSLKKPSPHIRTLPRPPPNMSAKASHRLTAKITGFTTPFAMSVFRLT